MLCWISKFTSTRVKQREGGRGVKDRFDTEGWRLQIWHPKIASEQRIYLKYFSGVGKVTSFSIWSIFSCVCCEGGAGGGCWGSSFWYWRLTSANLLYTETVSEQLVYLKYFWDLKNGYCSKLEYFSVCVCGSGVRGRELRIFVLILKTDDSIFNLSRNRLRTTHLFEIFRDLKNGLCPSFGCLRWGRIVEIWKYNCIKLRICYFTSF